MVHAAALGMLTNLAANRAASRCRRAAIEQRDRDQVAIALLGGIETLLAARAHHPVTKFVSDKNNKQHDHRRRNGASSRTVQQMQKSNWRPDRETGQVEWGGAMSDWK